MENLKEKLMKEAIDKYGEIRKINSNKEFTIPPMPNRIQLIIM